MTFQPGNDLGGRTAGSRNKTSYALRERLRSRPNHIDPAEFLADLVSNPAEPADIRIAASGQLMPYYHSKLGATPITPDPIYVQEAVDLPRPSTIDQAADNIARLTEMKATGKLDFATVDSLISDQRVILDALIDQAKLLTAQGGSPNQTIRIEGGLPPLVGTDIIMPQLNGNIVPAVSSIQGPEPPPPVDFNADPRPYATPYNDGEPPNEDL
jgi:hypothetical protein